jgi:hypothetical protein
MAYFNTKNPNLGIFWRALEWKKYIYFLANWNILWPIGIFYGHYGVSYGHSVYFSKFGILFQEKSGTPA